MPAKLIVDTDVGFGLPGQAVDSGLAILYLLTQEHVDLTAVCAVAGELPLDAVMDSAKWTLRTGKRSDIPVIPGSPAIGEYRSEAAEFLAGQAAAHPGSVNVLCTGSLANLYGAREIDPDFFDNIGRIIVSGGLFYPFQVPKWGGRGNLLMARDAFAASQVLKMSLNPVVLNMHVSSLLKFSLDDILACKKYSNRLYYLCKEYLLSEHCRNLTGKDEMYLWSMAAALYCSHSELFEESTRNLAWESDGSGNGYLRFNETGNPVCFPENIKDISSCLTLAHSGWSAIFNPGGEIDNA